MTTVHCQSRSPRLAVALIVAAAAVACSLTVQHANATQHLVSPGDNWQHLAEELRPGDEIILFPGRHLPARFEGLDGNHQQPIIIRSLDPRNPAVIIADEFGIALTRPRYVHLRDIHIVGARKCGILLSDGLNAKLEQSGAFFKANVQISNLQIRGTGPIGDADAVRIEGLQEVQLASMRIEGWADCAIEIVGCRFIDIEACIFKPLPDHAQRIGLNARAGSQTISVRDSLFLDAAVTAISAGGPSEAYEFRPALADSAGADIEENLKGRKAADGSRRPEVDQLSIERCLVRGSDTAIKLVGAASVTLRSSTIIQPRVRVLHAVLLSERDERCQNITSGLTLGENIFIYAADLKRPFEWSAIDVDSMRIEENLWYMTDAEASTQVALDLPAESTFPQIIGIHPELNARAVATASEARGLGYQRLDEQD
ncbi:MAG: right-handed parallel beta-helix repeat-containing protein [Phycisphaerales bacterium]